MHKLTYKVVMVYDNDLEYEWSWDREINGNTGDIRIFRQVQASQRIIVICSVFLYCSWQLVLCRLVLYGCLYPSFYIQGGRGYKKGNRVSYNIIIIRTLSLLVYFTYIFIDIILYALGKTPWSSRIFRMVGQVIADPSLGLPSPCGVVPRVPIIASSPGVFGKWVGAVWSGSSLSITNLLSTQSRNQVLRHEIAECFSTKLIKYGHRVGAPTRCSPRLSN
jgi:hypothetical protein